MSRLFLALIFLTTYIPNDAESRVVELKNVD